MFCYVYSLPLEDVTIRGGSDDGQRGGQSSKIDMIFKNFSSAYVMDVALLKTKTKLVFNKYLKPIKLVRRLPKEASTVDLSGFGQSDVSNQNNNSI